MIDLLHQMWDAARPEGIFESLAVQRLVGAWWHFERFLALAMQCANTDDAARHRKDALRWEACYNRAMRELRTLQTARAITNPADQPPPMANVKRNPDCKGGVADPPTKPVQSAKSTSCETNPQPEQVGRNSPCPCGSGQKYKRCCGVNAPPILNNAA